SWNGLRSNNLRIGQRLTIYPRKNHAVVSTSSSSAKTSTNTVSSTDSKVHTVQSGNSLWTISKKYPGITIDNLRDWNGISGNDIKPGTILKLCDCSSQTNSAMKKIITLALASFLILTSCNSKPKKAYLPESIGAINSLAVVMDNQLW